MQNWTACDPIAWTECCLVSECLLDWSGYGSIGVLRRVALAVLITLYSVRISSFSIAIRLPLQLLDHVMLDLPMTTTSGSGARRNESAR